MDSTLSVWNGQHSFYHTESSILLGTHGCPGPYLVCTMAAALASAL